MNQDLDPWPHCVTHTFQFGKFEIIHKKRIQEKILYTKIHQTEIDSEPMRNQVKVVAICVFPRTVESRKE